MKNRRNHNQKLNFAIGPPPISLIVNGLASNKTTSQYIVLSHDMYDYGL